MKLRNLLILIVVAAAIVFAATKLRETADTTSVDAGRYYPDLSERLNEVAVIVSRQGDQTTTLKRDEGRWLLEERGDFPVDVTKIRAFLKGVADLTKLEQKTDNPELYTKLDLEDPTVDGAKSIQFILKTESDETLADVVIGKDRSSTADIDKRDLYIRSPDDPTSWLVESDITIHREQNEWMDPTIINIHRDRIEQMFVEHPFGDDVFINREKPTDEDYTLKDVPEDQQLEYKFQLKDMANAFTSLDFDDVAVDEGVDFDAENVLRTTLDTFDGMRVVMLVGDKNGERWSRFRVDKSGRDIDVDMESSEMLKDMSAVEAEIKSLNDRLSGWIYRVRDYKLESITRAKDELLVTDGGGDGGVDVEPLAPGAQESFMSDLPILETDSEAPMEQSEEPSLAPAAPESDAPKSSEEN